MNDTADLPQIDHDPQILQKLSRAYRVLQDAADAQEKEAKAAYNKVVDSHAAYVARCNSALYQLVAEAHDAGYSSTEINRHLYH